MCPWGYFWRSSAFTLINWLKCITLSNMEWGVSLNLLKTWVEEKGGRMANLISMLELRQLSSTHNVNNTILQLLDSNQNEYHLLPDCQVFRLVKPPLSWFSNLQTTDSGTSQPPYPCQPNSYNKFSVFVCMCMCVWMHLSIYLSTYLSLFIYIVLT
jgi:hypothetical protein